MSKFSFDLSKFKKSHSDANSTVLKHADGHELRVDHKKLPKALKSQLDKLEIAPQKMADGGFPNPQPNPAPEETPEAQPQQPVAQAPSQPLDIEQVEPPTAPTPTPEPEEEPAPKEAPAAAPKAVETPKEETPKSPEYLFSNDKGSNLNVIAQEDAALANDIYKGHIQPKTYSDLFADKSTLGKIGSIFGLMIGGAGAGLTHTENPIIAMWKQQIGNDLEAQKANIGNKQTLLAMNRQRMPDLESATNFSRMQQNRMALHSLTDMVQRLPQGSPQRQNAEAQLAVIGQFVNTENYSLADQIASKQAFIHSMQGQGSGEEPAFQAQQNLLRRGGGDQQKLAEENEKHHMAGVQGQSSIALTPDNRDTMQSKQLFNDRLQDFIGFAQKNSGSLDPRVIAQGKAKAAELNGLYRNATHGGVYKEGEAEFINNLIDSNPTKFFNTVRGVIPKAQELMSNNMQSLNSYKKSLGFPIQQQQAQAQPQGGGETRSMGGVQYQKVAGGWKRVQ